MKLLFLQDFPPNAKGGGAYIYKRLLLYAKQFNASVTIAYDINAYGQDDEPDSRSIPFYTMKRFFRFGLGRLMGFLTILGLDQKLNRSVKKIIKDEMPDVIHITAHGVSFPSCVNVAHYSGKPVAITVHDLWHTSVNQYVSAGIARSVFKKAICKAHVVFVISKNMGNHLVKEYGISNYSVIHDGSKTTIPKEYDPAVASLPTRFMYAGILYPMQCKMFDAIILAMAQLPGNNFEIHICTGKPYVPPIEQANISIHNYGWVKEDRLAEIGKQCSIGLLPLSFAREDELFYRTSLMTKIPFYIRAQLPILCIGPTTSSSVELIKELKIGYTITSDDIKAILPVLTQISNVNRPAYEALQVNLSKASETGFNIDSISERFYNALFSLSNNDIRND